jgi:anaerobic sulfite reductase subunit A
VPFKPVPFEPVPFSESPESEGQKEQYVDSIFEYSALISNRENLYLFLGRLYKIEVDQALLEQMKALSFPDESSEEELVAGYRMLEVYLRQPGYDVLTDLAVDYARVFIGAGIAEAEAAYPYESIYTSPKRLVMQEAWSEMVDIYRAKGLEKSERLDIPEDHIALELELMAFFCHETQEAIAAKNWAAVAANLKEQREFLEKHLLNWVPAFCADIQKYAETKFYQAAAKITNGYLRLDRAMLEGLIADIDAEVARPAPCAACEPACGVSIEP